MIPFTWPDHLSRCNLILTSHAKCVLYSHGKVDFPEILVSGLKFCLYEHSSQLTWLDNMSKAERRGVHPINAKRGQQIFL